MKCEHYCPGCAIGDCPKMKEMVEEKGRMQAMIVALSEELEKAWGMAVAEEVFWDH